MIFTSTYTNWKLLLQLVGVTALPIATKVEEMYPPDIKDFIYIHNGRHIQYRADAQNGEENSQNDRFPIWTTRFHSFPPKIFQSIKEHSTLPSYVQVLHRTCDFGIFTLSLQTIRGCGCCTSPNFDFNQSLV